MKDKGVPISLFSFQDIVTSLTGIMVIVILVIVLQLAEAVFEYEKPRAENPEYQELKRKMTEVAQKIEQLNNAGEQIPDEVMAFANTSKEKIDSTLNIEENANAAMRAEQAKNTEELTTIKLSLDQILILLNGVDAKMANARKAKQDSDRKIDTVKKDNTIPQMRKDLDELQRRCERLKNEIKINADKVEFSFTGVLSRQPIIIECYGIGFNAQLYKANTPVKSFAGGSFQSNLSELCTWLNGMDMEKCYPLLLLRRNAFSHLNEIQLRISSLGRNIVLGKEPLDDNVRVF